MNIPLNMVIVGMIFINEIYIPFLRGLNERMIIMMIIIIDGDVSVDDNDDDTDIELEEGEPLSTQSDWEP